MKRVRKSVAHPVAGGAVFRVDRAWLRSMKVHRRGPRAEELVRADRDAKG